MKLTITTSLIIVVLGLISFSEFASANSDLPVFDAQNHSKISGKKLQAVFTTNTRNLSAFNKINLLAASVDFRKYWERDQRRNSLNRRGVSAEDIAKIKSSLAEEFTNIISSSLVEAGYKLIDEPDEGTLIIRPPIINLDITAPDTEFAGRTRSYTNTAGEMALYLEYFNPQTAELIATASDQQRDPRFSDYYTWTTSVSNRAAARRMIHAWADMLIKQLATAKMGK